MRDEQRPNNLILSWSYDLRSRAWRGPLLQTTPRSSLHVPASCLPRDISASPLQDGEIRHRPVFPASKDQGRGMLSVFLPCAGHRPILRQGFGLQLQSCSASSLDRECSEDLRRRDVATPLLSSQFSHPRSPTNTDPFFNSFHWTDQISISTRAFPVPPQPDGNVAVPQDLLASAHRHCVVRLNLEMSTGIQHEVEQ